MSKTPLLISIISTIALLVSVVTLINLGTTRNSTPTAHESMQNGNLVHDTMDESMVNPTMPGQEAFGTIQEIMNIIEADTQTDWSSVDLEALRQHLIDMNELTMNTQLTTQKLQ